MLYFGRFLRKLSRQTQDKLADSAGLASEYIFAATTIQTNSYNDNAVKEYNKLIEDSYLTSKTRVFAILAGKKESQEPPKIKVLA